MKKLVVLLICIVGVLVIACIGAAVVGLCPPQGPWPLPPWCEGSQFSWPFTPKSLPTLEATEIAGGIDRSTAESQPSQVGLAAVTTTIITDLSLIQEYFDTGLMGMGAFTPKVNLGMGFSGRLKVVHLACLAPSIQHGPPKIPSGFMAPLGSSGFITAPSGACAAGASPKAQFQDAEENAITAEKLAEENVTVIDYEILTGENPEIKSLEQIISESIVPGDLALATPEGWNEKVWEPLRQVQTPMESLMDYQLWNTSNEIEDMVVASMQERMASMGLPDTVLNAFEQSDHHGWFASRYAEQANELAAMYIIAEFSGDLQGIIEETRSFRIPEVGKLPEFGIMTGEGVVGFDHPQLGHIVFDVELEWTEWDEMGRVIGGTMDLIDQAGIYEIHFVFNSDGTKEGELFMNGVPTGTVMMDVEGSSTYLDLRQNQAYPIGK